MSDQPVSYVNAPQLAEEHGIEIRPTTSTTPRDYVNLVTIRSGDHAVAGTLVGLKGSPTVVMIDDFAVDIPPVDHMIIIRNEDVPGMIGEVGTALGRSSVNISDMVVGQDSDGVAALMALSIDEAPPHDVIEALRSIDGIRSVTTVHI